VNNFWRDLRLIPVVLLATVCLLVLKVSGLVFDGGYTLAERLQKRDSTGLTITTAESVPQYPKIVVADAAAPNGFYLSRPDKPWAQDMFNFNGDTRDITGSVGHKEEKKEESKEEGHGEKSPGKIAGMPVSDKPPEPTKVEVGGAVVQGVPGRSTSPGERAVLERLQERRQELDSRNRELDMRESLLKAAEKKLETEPAPGKPGAKGSAEGGGAAGQGRDEVENARFKSVVTIYETMKPKDAAKIFDRLDIRVLLEMASQIKPQIMSAIMAQMSPEAAERLTIELAAKNGAERTLNPMNLPKIEGRRGG